MTWPRDRSGSAAELPRREYGTTGERLSVIGFGGILVTDEEQADADRLVAEAIERGVNYFDVAPTYGNAELRLAPALKPYRKDVFLACKTNCRTADEAAAELARSLERFQTDHFDLYQLHGLTRVERDVDTAFAKGGAMEVLRQARKDGRARYLGFSAHSPDAALAALDRFDFDSVLFPVDFASWFRNGFGPQIVARAGERGAACLALKVFARQRWPQGDPERETYRKCWYQPITDRREAELSLRWALSQPVVSAVSPGMPSLLAMALDAAANLRPVNDDEIAELKALAETLNPIMPEG